MICCARKVPCAEFGLAAAHWIDDRPIDQMLAHPIRINRPILVTRWGVKLCQPSGGIGDARMRVVVNPYMGTLTDAIVWVQAELPESDKFR